ncbi:hypothetical protein PV327_003614 [Microctonus hyperodae]|uniref:BCL2-associated athanogene 6 n=1 Tax=Microctonus hyperodae TaxID=165561 RepID=A0AA39G5B4_MICHY|nr:hypothetical protein PV327_003614 [Microctonus hyperodae]
MIDLTVKTLDSQNHAFSLNDDITVRQFKDHIADTVNISADLQRLIYCGRVLQDEKLLSEYDVNGKVIHLVQRAPPSSTQRSHSNNQSQGQSHGGTGEWQSTPRVLYRHTQFHDDPMYIGSFSIPADVLEGYEWPSPQLSNTIATSHLSVVRRMLDQANNVIDRLDNPSAPSSSSTSTGNNSSSSTQSNQTQSTTASATESDNSTWTASASTTEINAPTLKTNENSDVNSTTTPSETNKESSQQQSRDDTTPQHSASNQASSSESNDTASSSNEALVPRELAELLELLLTTQDRLRPYIRNRLLSNGTAAWPQLTNDENQRVIDGVTECFHFLSHAQHALSNLNINMQQPPPRTLRCRPMVIQPSAILQAGLPIQVEAHISLHGQNENNPDSDDNTTNSSRPSQPTTQTTTSTANNETSSSIGSNSQPQFTSSQSTPETPRQASQQQSQSQTAFGTVFNFPNNVEVVMESAPQASRVWSFSTSDNQGSSNNNNNNNVTNNNNGNSTSGSNTGATGIGGGSFPWGGAPSPDIIRNLIQAVTGYMTQAGVAHASPPATTSSSSPSNPSTNATPMGCPRHRATGGNESTNSGQNSQTRGNTETHPTTSTQTRTTSRTHVFHQHAQALGVGVGLAHSMEFDPFLPCNSHHIRRGNSSSSTSSQPASATAATTNIAASTQTGGQNNTSTGANASTQARTPVGTVHSRRTTIRGVQFFDNLFDNTSLAETIANFERISRSIESGIPLSSLLSYRGTNLLGDTNSRSGGILRLIFNVLGNLPVHVWFSFVRNDSAPIDDSFIYVLCNQIHQYIGESSNGRVPLIATQLVCNELRSILDLIFRGECAFDNNGREIDLHATIYKMLESFVRNLGTAIFDDDCVAENIVQMIRDFGRDLSSLLKYCFNRQSRVERIIERLAREMTRGTHERFRTWIFGTVVEWFNAYTRQVARSDDPKILEYIVYKTDMTEVATTSSETTPNRPDTVLEPMEIDTESNSHAPTHNSWMEEDDIIPATFPGEENLMPDWIPIVARDAVTQRRQLSLSDDDVTTMSDAYLSTMPSKRRKLVEQRKAPLLMNPSSNRSAIPSSMERLIRESVGRAGFEEVDGAVAAIAADPTVRRAFGQAIRESLNPRRYQTPDFPDALRFPNATKFFTNPNRPAKQ